MGLVFAFAGIAVGSLLLTMGLTGASAQEVFEGKAKLSTTSSSAAAITAGGGDIAAGLDTAGLSNTTVTNVRGGGKLNQNQQTFAKELAKQTGLNLSVVSGWLLAEEPASALSAPNGANNWLNVGSDDSGFVGGAASVWDSPITAADATASFILGKPVNGIQPPGQYGSSSIRSIASTADKGINAQVAAIENSDWASSHYGHKLAEIVDEFL